MHLRCPRPTAERPHFESLPTKITLDAPSGPMLRWSCGVPRRFGVAAGPASSIGGRPSRRQVGHNGPVFGFRGPTDVRSARSLYEPRDLLHAYEDHATREVRPDSGEVLIRIPLRDGTDLEVTIVGARPEWTESRVRALCTSLTDVDRRMRRVLGDAFVIGWIELDAADHGTIDYWEVGVNSEYAVDIVWTGDGWAVDRQAAR